MAPSKGMYLAILILWNACVYQIIPIFVFVMRFSWFRVFFFFFLGGGGNLDWFSEIMSEKQGFIFIL